MHRFWSLPLLLAALALPVHAGLFDDEQARARIDRLASEHAARLDKLEAGSRGQLELASQIEMLRADLAKLRGQIEVLTFEMEQSQKRQKDFYVDLDNRLRKIEAPPVPPVSEKPQIDPAAEARDYEAALGLFKGGKYKEAVAAFEAFVKAYAGGRFLPSASYWSGQALYQLRDCRRASDVFNHVSATWPDDPKASDAMLGTAICQTEANDQKGARSTLEAIVAKYPTSPAAAAAKDRLKRLRK